ncbi:hypothetical protein BH09BAC5_BH09BAC5_15910 [soil metagenome]
MRQIILFLLVSLFSNCLFAQNQKSIDSLTTVLKTATDTNRVNSLLELSDVYHNDNPEKATEFAREAIALADKIQYTSGIFHANMGMALAFYVGGNLDSAIFYFEIARQQAEKNKNITDLASVYSNFGNVYGDKGDNRKCIQYYLIASDYTAKLNKPDKAAYIIVNIGTVYSVLGQHDSALVYYVKAKDLLTGIDKNQVKLPIVYNNIGATYLELKDTAKAEIAFTEALRISTFHNNQRGLATAYDHLGVIVFSKGFHDSAFVMLNNAISIYEKTGSKAGISEARVHLGELYFIDKKYDQAIECLNTGRIIAVELQDYYNLKMYYSVLSQVYEAKGDFQKALDFHKQFTIIKDTIFNLNNSNVVSEMKTQLENEKGLREIEALNAKDQKKTFIIYSAIAVGFLFLLLLVVFYNRYQVKKRSGEMLALQNEEIQNQKDIIEEKNKDVTDSIRYAQRIQNAILPSKEAIKGIFAESFVLFRPKDIVSGDFYWFEDLGDYKLFSVVDCTGHGVPGAMLSVVGNNLLNKAVLDEKLIMPDKLLQYLNENISHMLRQKHEDTIIEDGMDIAMCAYHVPTQTLYYSGSFNSLYHIHNGILTETKSDKLFIGNYYIHPDKKFQLHSIKAEKGDAFYVFSDGFADQFGGPAGKKFKYKPFQDLLLKIHKEKMEMQGEILNATFDEWKSKLDQVDDVCVIGIRI